MQRTITIGMPKNNVKGIKMFEPPKNYNEMLTKLHKATFFTTLIYSVVLVVFEYIPLIGLPSKYVPPVKDYEELIKWALSFGVLPLVVAIIAFVVSGALDLHNNVAKFLRIRYLWDKYLIIKPLAKIAGINRKMNKVESHLIMRGLYYPAVLEIADTHYVNLFWNKAYYFWVFFEHAIIVFISIVIITTFKLLNTFHVNADLTWLWAWFSSILLLTFAVFMTSVKQRTESQVRQIPNVKVTSFFSDNDIN